MNKLKNTIEQKLGDHPNASANDNVNPDSGTGKAANQGDGASPLPTYLPYYHIDLMLTQRSSKMPASPGSRTKSKPGRAAAMR